MFIHNLVPKHIMNFNKKIFRSLFALIISIILLQSSFYAQSLLFDRDEFFNTILMQKYKLNSYYVGNNPAFLDKELSDERLLIESGFSNSQGNFKAFIAPGDQSDAQLNFTGKKKISEHGIFKGSAGYQYEIRNNWNWIANKNYERANPFLFGDSTTGSTRFNSILLNAQYSTLLPMDIRIGVSLDYAVDEGFKKVTPKPISSHRDLMLNVGLGYDINDNNSIGATFRYYDYNEEINYEEDESSLYDNSVIFKFTGYDYPSVYYIKTEQRLAVTNQYTASIDFVHTTNSFIAAISAAAGFDKQILDDDSNEKDPQGFSKCDYVSAKINLLYKLSDSFTTTFLYRYDNSSMWARYADYNVQIMEEQVPSHLFNLGLEYAISRVILLGIEGGMRIHNYDMNDYYSGITAGYDGQEYFAGLGLEYQLSSHFSTACGISYNKNDLSDRVLEYGAVGNIFLEYRKSDLLYKITPYSSYAAFIKADLDVNQIGQITINIIYSKTDPQDEVVFEGFDKQNVSAWVQFRRQVY